MARAPSLPCLGLFDPPLHLPYPTLIDGYRLEGYLGHGHEGTVYHGVERSSGIEVAVKLIPYDLAAWHAARRTARRFHQLRGVGLTATYHKLGRLSLPCGRRLIYLVFDRIRGRPLADCLEQKRWSPHWTEQDGFWVLRRLVEGLAKAHRLGLAIGDFWLGNNVLLVGANVPIICDLAPGEAYRPNRAYDVDLEMVAEIAATMAEVRRRSLRLAAIAATAQQLGLKRVGRRTMSVFAYEIAELQ